MPRFLLKAPFEIQQASSVLKKKKRSMGRQVVIVKWAVSSLQESLPEARSRKTTSLGRAEFAGAHHETVLVEQFTVPGRLRYVCLCSW